MSNLLLCMLKRFSWIFSFFFSQVLDALDEVGDILQLKYSKLSPPKPICQQEKSKDD